MSEPEAGTGPGRGADGDGTGSEPEAASGPQDASQDGWPPLPDSVTVADEIDLDAADPCVTERGRRLCVAQTRAGDRCTASARRDALVCQSHAGLLDSRKGGLALAQQRRDAVEAREARATLARSGTRAVVAAALAEKHSEIRLALHVLATAAAAGDVRSAQALIPWLNQGLGMPTERIETSAGEAADLAALSTPELEQLVASRRAERLRIVEDEKAEQGG